MTNSALDHLSRELRLILPPEVRESLRDRDVFDAVRWKFQQIGPVLGNYEDAVEESTSAFLRENRLARAELRWTGWSAVPPDVTGEPNHPQPWRHEWFVLGSPDGATTFVDLSAAGFSLCLHDHDGERCHRLYQSFADWCRLEKEAAARARAASTLAPRNPCPFCGAALRTAAAQQCFSCGAKWHGKPRPTAGT